MHDETLLGFDVRDGADEDPCWDARRRQQFLLRTGVPRPLSVDTMVWPSLFGVAGAGDQAALPVPDWIGPNQDLWDRLERMDSWLAERKPVDGLAVAIGWLSRQAFRDTGRFGEPYRGEIEPAGPRPGWRLLGYDVADGFLLSGLSNCGYTSAEALGLSSRWAPAMNAHHLFADVELAFEYVEVSNGRVPGHAPFHVYSLYDISV